MLVPPTQQIGTLIAWIIFDILPLLVANITENGHSAIPKMV